MPKPIIPVAPTHLYKLRFWTVTNDQAVERVWTFYLEPTPCEEVLGPDHAFVGEPFVNQWYTGGGRYDGWALPDFKPRYYDMWIDVWPTRLEALRHYQKQLKNRRISEQEALQRTNARLAAVEKELAGVLNKRDRRALRRAAEGKTIPGTLPERRALKLAAQLPCERCGDGSLLVLSACPRCGRDPLTAPLGQGPKS